MTPQPPGTTRSITQTPVGPEAGQAAWGRQLASGYGQGEWDSENTTGSLPVSSQHKLLGFSPEDEDSQGPRPAPGDQNHGWLASVLTGSPVVR